MRSANRKTTPSLWPFGLLLLAWFCANCPTLATYAVVWIGEAHSFSHQQRLSIDVARVLVGEQSPSLLTGIKKLPPEPTKPVLPSNSSVKKIELAVEEYIHPRAPDMPITIMGDLALSWKSALRNAPPYEPPRAEVVS